MAVPGSLTRRWRAWPAGRRRPARGRLRRGAGDPTHRGSAWARPALVPGHPDPGRAGAAVKLWPGRRRSSRAPGATGAEWALDQLPRLAGADDDLAGFAPRPEHAAAGRGAPPLAALPGRATDAALRGARAGLHRAGRHRQGGVPRLAAAGPASSASRRPGPARDPARRRTGCGCRRHREVWARVPSWRFLAAGVEQRRSRTLVRAARRAAALERTLTWPASTRPTAALRSLPGVGPWTSAEVRQRAHGDADAWSIGDYHVGKHITYALTGEALDDDACAGAAGALPRPPLPGPDAAGDVRRPPPAPRRPG